VIQREAAEAAQAVARFFNVVSTESQRLRFEADSEIARQVAALNSALAKIDELNKQISAAQAAGRDATALEDERERQIDVVNGIVPIRAQKRDNGAVSLFTQGGGVMLDVRPVPLTFSPTGPIAPEMTLEGGELSNIVFNGRDAAPTAPTNAGVLRGGALEAAFRVRDETVPGFTAQLDALARDLIERFQEADPTLAGPGEAGLFAVGPFGSAFDGATDPQVGLAGRIMLNPLVDPEAGGDPARMRDGLSLTALPRSGDPTIALAFLDAFTGLRQPAQPVSATPPNAPIAGAGFDAPRSAAALAAQVGAMRSSAAARAEQAAAFTQGVAATAQEAELRVSAVDTDAELRRLIELENAYAANARVISAIDEMMRRILEI
jgi:flagellar hook-associated protein 1 FlgK